MEDLKKAFDGGTKAMLNFESQIDQDFLDALEERAEAADEVLTELESQWSYSQGYKEGLEIGHTKGYVEGYRDGLKEARENIEEGSHDQGWHDYEHPLY